MANPIFDQLEDVSLELQQVKKLIDSQLTTDELVFSETVKTAFNQNSKMIRPALALICSSYKKGKRDKAISLAAAMEILHVATLIHDDIIDDSDLRRGVKTIHKTHDTGFAVICGDYLFAKSYQLLFETQKVNELQLMGTNVVKMCFGEVEQYMERFNQAMSLEKYFSIIEKKTAGFFESNCVLGAKLANCSQDQVDALKAFGHNLGMLFQVQDDILDFEKSQAQIGKPALADINRGNFSLPLLIAMDQKPELMAYIKDNKTYEMDVIVAYMEKTNALEKAKDYCKQYLNNIEQQLSKISNQEVKEKLTYLVNKVVKREM